MSPKETANHSANLCATLGSGRDLPRAYLVFGVMFPMSHLPVFFLFFDLLPLTLLD